MIPIPIADAKPWNAFERFKCANAGAVSLTSEERNTNTRIVTKEMKRSARNIGLGFSSRAIVSGVNRCLTRKNGPNDIKHLAVECFKSMAVSGEEFTRSWNDCNVLVSLCKNIEMRGSKRANSRPVVEFLAPSRVWGCMESRKSYLKMGTW